MGSDLCLRGCCSETCRDSDLIHLADSFRISLDRIGLHEELNWWEIGESVGDIIVSYFYDTEHSVELLSSLGSSETETLISAISGCLRKLKIDIRLTLIEPALTSEGYRELVRYVKALKVSGELVILCLDVTLQTFSFRALLRESDVRVVFCNLGNSSLDRFLYSPRAKLYKRCKLRIHSLSKAHHIDLLLIKLKGIYLSLAYNPALDI